MFGQQCKKESIHFYEPDEEDIMDKSNIYPMCYLINKTEYEYSTLWIELKRALPNKALPFTIVKFVDLELKEIMYEICS